MKVGFTGTQIGMSLRQKAALREFLLDLEIDEFHHGDCIGADEEAHRLLLDLRPSSLPTIVIHPPINPAKRAYCRRFSSPGIKIVELNPQDYIERNHSIVDAVHGLIVAPKSDAEELRSGTWATYRYAKKIGKLTMVLLR